METGGAKIVIKMWGAPTIIISLFVRPNLYALRLSTAPHHSADCHTAPPFPYSLPHRTYLDVLKRVVFFSSYWLTLAVVFLAGINRITLLSLLYVASAFIFLWKGTDFYLLPFRDIRKR